MLLCGLRSVNLHLPNPSITFTFIFTQHTQLAKLPNECIQHPTPLMKLLITWSKFQRFKHFVL